MPNFAASRLVTGPFDEAVIRETAVQLREQLSGKPTFGLVFVTPDYADKAADLLEIVRVYGHVPTVVGCSGTGLVGHSLEQEEGPGFSLLFVSLPGGKATSISFSQDMVEGSNRPDYWHAAHRAEAGRRQSVARFPQSLFAQRRDLAEAMERSLPARARFRRHGRRRRRAIRKRGSFAMTAWCRAAWPSRCRAISRCTPSFRRAASRSASR